MEIEMSKEELYNLFTKVIMIAFVITIGIDGFIRYLRKEWLDIPVFVQVLLTIASFSVVFVSQYNKMRK